MGQPRVPTHPLEPDSQRPSINVDVHSGDTYSATQHARPPRMIAQTPSANGRQVVSREEHTQSISYGYRLHIPSISQTHFGSPRLDSTQPFDASQWADSSIEYILAQSFIPLPIDDTDWDAFRSMMGPLMSSEDSSSQQLGIAYPSDNQVDGTSLAVSADATQGHSSAVAESSDALSTVINEILGAGDQTEPGLSKNKVYLYSLWELFLERVVPYITPFGNRTDNPLTNYLAPKARRSPALMTAILYLTQIISRRSHHDPLDAEVLLNERAEDILQVFQRDNTSLPGILEDSEVGTEQMVVTLSTMLVFCMAFMASHDAVRFVIYMEYAGLICQVLFKKLAEDDGFLCLAKLLGFMQNSLLFSDGDQILNAPDYLGVALDFHDRNGDELFKSDGKTQCHFHFRDVDLFFGISASMARILHTLGVLTKRKKAGLHRSHANQGEWARAFNSDVDGLEARLRRHLNLLSRPREADGGAASTSQPSRDRSLAWDLHLYNEALFWSAWAIFLTDLKDRYPATDAEVRDSVDHALDACAEIPKESVVAPLLLFPLAVAGMRSTKKVYRDFVVHRLESLGNVYITDTRSLCADLEDWWNNRRPADSPIAFTSKLVF
jgi:hypothetical protein